MRFWTRARPGRTCEAYDRQAQKLVNMFADNFAQYVPYIADDVKAAAIG
jgi:phosphoenolpyruvate carboxykinase (ATP)